MRKKKNSEPDMITVPHEKSFFISANGYSGFRSRHTVFYGSPQYTRVFVITGGPGTGKSRLMHDVAKAAKLCRADVTYIRCSSDPDSLDGIVISKEGTRIALLDGTAPHVRVIDYPGVIDEWIDLSLCWQTDALISKREEILSATKRKQEAYARAYRFLSIAGDADRALDAELRPAVLTEKLTRAVQREMRMLFPSAKPHSEEYYITACSMKGYTHLSTYRAESTVIGISDPYGGAHFYLDLLYRLLREKNAYTFLRFPSCYTDEKTENIYLPKSKVLFSSICCQDESKVINMKRFLNAQAITKNRSVLRHLLHVRRDMQDAACAALQEAGKHHFSLEEIYGNAMDFSKKEAVTERVKKQITSLLA